MISLSLSLLVLAACGTTGGTTSGGSKAADALWRQGVKAAQSGNHEEAIDYYTQAIARNQNLHYAYDDRAASYEDMGKHDEAIADYGQAIATAPPGDKAIYLFNRGRFFQRRNRIEEAERDFTAAVDRQKEFPHPIHMPSFYLGRALFYLETKQPNKCIADCDHLIHELKVDGDTKRHAEKLIEDAIKLKKND